MGNSKSQIINRSDINYDLNYNDSSEIQTLNWLSEENNIETHDTSFIKTTHTTNTDSPFLSKDNFNKILQGGGNKLNSISISDSNTSSFNPSNSDIFSSTSKNNSGNSNTSSFNPSNSDSLSSTSKNNSGNSNTSSFNPSNSDIFSSTSKNNSENVNSTSENSSENVNSTSEYNVKMYNFSNTSSEMIKTSEDNYYKANKANNVNSESSYNIDSSSINTSDINLVSIDSNQYKQNVGKRKL